MQVKRYELKYKVYMEIMITLDDKKWKLYSLVIGQCTEAILTELKGIEDFKERDTVFDCI